MSCSRQVTIVLVNFQHIIWKGPSLANDLTEVQDNKFVAFWLGGTSPRPI